MLHKLNLSHTPTKRENLMKVVMINSPKRLKNGNKENITYMYNKNRTVHHTNFVNILKRKMKRKKISDYLPNETGMCSTINSIKLP